MTDEVLYETRGRVGLVTLNRPEVLNAFSMTMYEGLIETLRRAGADEDVGAIVITGAGRAFSSGADVKRFQSAITGGEVGARRQSDFLARILQATYYLPKPVIAAINGAAVGVGATLPLACDLRYVSEKARIGFIFARVGLIPELASTFLLPRTVGLGNAKRLIFEAGMIPAQEALRIGLAQEVLPEEGFLDAALERATAIARLPTLALARAKQGMHQALGADAAAAERWEEETHTNEIRPSPEHAEGVQAFLEKREPDFAAARAAAQQ